LLHTCTHLHTPSFHAVQTEVNGLLVAYLDGTYDAAAYNSSGASSPGSPHYAKADVDALKKALQEAEGDACGAAPLPPLRPVCSSRLPAACAGGQPRARPPARASAAPAGPHLIRRGWRRRGHRPAAHMRVAPGAAAGRAQESAALWWVAGLGCSRCMAAGAAMAAWLVDAGCRKAEPHCPPPTLPRFPAALPAAGQPLALRRRQAPAARHQLPGTRQRPQLLRTRPQPSRRRSLPARLPCCRALQWRRVGHRGGHGAAGAAALPHRSGPPGVLPAPALRQQGPRRRWGPCQAWLAGWLAGRGKPVPVSVPAAYLQGGRL
jgi:hypothetical protein